MATLFGWAWPAVLGRFVKHGWCVLRLWSWARPYKVWGLHGETRPLVTWRPAVRPQVCSGEPWRRPPRGRRSIILMMLSATALAAPTIMEGNPTLNGGRLNLFRGAATSGNAPRTVDGPLTTLAVGGRSGGDGRTGVSGPQPTGVTPEITDLAGGRGEGPPSERPPLGEQPSTQQPATGADGPMVLQDPYGDLYSTWPFGAGGASGGGGSGQTSAGSGPTGGDPFNPAGPVPPDVEPSSPLLQSAPIPWTFPTPDGDAGPMVLVFQGLTGSGDGGGPPSSSLDDGGHASGVIVDDGRLKDPGAVPEPGAWIIMVFGFGAVGYVLRQRGVPRAACRAPRRGDGS